MVCEQGWGSTPQGEGPASSKGQEESKAAACRRKWRECSMAEPQNLNTGEWPKVKLSKSAGAGPQGA